MKLSPMCPCPRFKKNGVIVSVVSYLCLCFLNPKGLLKYSCYLVFMNEESK